MRVELYPTKTTTAVESASCIFQHFGRFGNAEVVHTDRGTAFHNELIEELLRMSGTEHLLTTANPTRRFYATSMRSCLTLEFMTGGTEDNEHGRETSTGVTPAQLILNNSISLSSQILQSQREMYPPGTTRPDHQIALWVRPD